MGSDELIEELAAHCHVQNAEAEIGSMFRRPALRYRGAVFAFMGFDDELLVKLPAGRIAELETAGIAEQVSMGKKTMREWAVVPALEPGATGISETWGELLLEAHGFVAARAAAKG